MQKDEIRKEMLRRLRDQLPVLREERSRIIQERLLSSRQYKVSSTVMVYVSLPTEVGTGDIIREALEQGKRIAVPYIRPQSTMITASELTAIDSLDKGPLGISQPREMLVKEIPLKEIDFIVVPAVAYDRKNMRLGRGKGFYDRFLDQEELRSAYTTGLAFNFQMLDMLPSDPHDRPVNRVITD